MSAPSPTPEEQTCALRALTLCDGQRLEGPDRALYVCLCAAERELQELGQVNNARTMREWRQELIEKTEPRQH